MAYSPEPRRELPPVEVFVVMIVAGIIGALGTSACLIVREVMRLF